MWQLIGACFLSAIALILKLLEMRHVETPEERAIRECKKAEARTARLNAALAAGDMDTVRRIARDLRMDCDGLLRLHAQSNGGAVGSKRPN